MSKSEFFSREKELNSLLISKLIGCICFIFIVFTCNAQVKVGFDYDPNGNRIKRYLLEDLLRQRNDTLRSPLDSIEGVNYLDESMIGDTISAFNKALHPNIGGYIDIDVRIFPNPTNEVVNIEALNGFRINKIELYDPKGVLVNTLEGQTLNVINMVELPSGNYKINVYGEFASKFFSVIKY